MAQSTGSLKCPVRSPLRGSICRGGRRGGGGKDVILRPRDSKVLSVLGRGVTAFSPGRPTFKTPPLPAYWRGRPITWPTCLHEIPPSVPWHLCYTGRPTRSPAGGGSRVQTLPARGREKEGVLAPGPTLYRPPTSLDTIKVNSWKNRSERLVTWGMCVKPTPGSHATLFSRRDQTRSALSSRRLSSACASLTHTAHAEPLTARKRQRERGPSSSLTIESRSSEDKEYGP